MKNLLFFCIFVWQVVFLLSFPSNLGIFRSLKQDETRISLQWNKVNDNVSFILQYNGTEINISAPDEDALIIYTVSSLSAGTKYTFTLFSVFENVRSSGVEITAVTGKIFDLLSFGRICFAFCTILSW